MKLQGFKGKTLGVSGAQALNVISNIPLKADRYVYFVLPNLKAAFKQKGRSRKIVSPSLGLLEVGDHAR